MSYISGQPIEAQLDRFINGVSYTVIFESTPFAKGACRLAFRGVYNGKRCVTKVFIDDAKRYYGSYVPDIKASQKANELAQAFNARYSSTKPLRFVVPELATVTKVPGGNAYARPGDKILVEDFIEGNYEKFSNNDTWQTDEVAAIPAFSHFTYCVSNGEFLVCDIQGVRNPNGYTLTDPAVHSRMQGAYGPTDLGPTGMTRFFEAHRCSSVCGQMPRPEYNGIRRINKGRADRRASTYTFMLGNSEIEANNFFRSRKDLPAVLY